MNPELFRRVPELFRRVSGVSADLAMSLSQLVGLAIVRAECRTPFQKAAFIATLGHESQGFTKTKENLNYSAEALRASWPHRFSEAQAQLYGRTKDHPADQTAIARLAYGKRKDLGNITWEHGAMYPGRGWIQLTGLRNYQIAQDRLRHPYVTQPHLVEEPYHAAMTSADYWVRRQLNDYDDFLRIGKAVNLGDPNSPRLPNGWDDRWSRFQRALSVFEAEKVDTLAGFEVRNG